MHLSKMPKYQVDLSIQIEHKPYRYDWHMMKETCKIAQRTTFAIIRLSHVSHVYELQQNV